MLPLQYRRKNDMNSNNTSSLDLVLTLDITLDITTSI